jgi:preprotein translocase subunit SecA
LEITRQELERITKEDLKEKLAEIAMSMYEAKEAEFGNDVMRDVERIVLLRVVDQKWMDHIDAMDQLRYGIGLRAYGQRDPVIEYKFEGFEMFEEMIRNIQEDAIKMIMHAHPQNTIQREKVAEPVNASLGGDEVKKPAVRSDKVGRNDQCPCGSGKKYKKCCGAN